MLKSNRIRTIPFFQRVHQANFEMGKYIFCFEFEGLRLKPICGKWYIFWLGFGFHAGKKIRRLNRIRTYKPPEKIGVIERAVPVVLICFLIILVVSVYNLI